MKTKTVHLSLKGSFQVLMITMDWTEGREGTVRAGVGERNITGSQSGHVGNKENKKIFLQEILEKVCFLFDTKSFYFSRN